MGQSIVYSVNHEWLGIEDANGTVCWWGMLWIEEVGWGQFGKFLP